MNCRARIRYWSLASITWNAAILGTIFLSVRLLHLRVPVEDPRIDSWMGFLTAAGFLGSLGFAVVAIAKESVNSLSLLALLFSFADFFFYLR